jgi:hypothetical protein
VISISNFKSFTERDVGGGLIMYVTYAKSNVRRCIQDVAWWKGIPSCISAKGNCFEEGTKGIKQ